MADSPRRDAAAVAGNDVPPVALIAAVRPAASEPPAVADEPLSAAGLVRDHAAALYRYAFRLTGAAADAEDLTQQTFLIAHRKLTQLREPGGARRWLMTIMRRAYLRTAQSRDYQARRLAAPLDVDRLPAAAADDLDLDAAELQAAVNALPDDYKLVLLAFYFEDRSYREIAAEFGLPIGTVMSRLSRAKAHLRSRLFDHELRPRRAMPRGPVRIATGGKEPCDAAPTNLPTNRCLPRHFRRSGGRRSGTARIGPVGRANGI